MREPIYLDDPYDECESRDWLRQEMSKPGAWKRFFGNLAGMIALVLALAVLISLCVK